MTYSLAMIVRNCADNLERLLDNFGAYPDEIVIVNTGIDESEEGFVETNAVAEKHGARIFHFPWVDDFSKARQFSFNQCENDMVLWLDSDDTIQHPKEADQEIRRLIAEGCRWQIGEYLYEWDGEPLESNCTTRLLRERVVDKNIFIWKAPIHECLCAKYTTPGRRMNPEMFRVVHHQQRADQAEVERKLARNIEVFEKNFADGNCETRMKFYWGNTLMGLKRYPEAVSKFKAYLGESDNRPERTVAICSISECYRLDRKFGAAYRIAVEGIADNPQLPSPWLQAAEAAFANRDYARAVVLSEEVKNRVNFLSDEMVSNPKSVYARPWFIQAVAYTGMGRFDDAKKAVAEAVKWYPEDEEILEVIKEIESISRHHEALRSFQRVVSMAPEGRREVIARSMPEEFQGEHIVSQYVPKKRPADRPSIAFFCPPMKDVWGPDSTKEGIGGSEEAVINITREFARKGWHVEVYAKISKVTVDQYGVHWYTNGHWTGENDSPLDVAVWWRCPDILRQLKSPASQNYLWLHDVVSRDQFGPESWNDFDKVFVLTQYHREVVEYVPDEKIFFTENGMDPEILVPEHEIVKDPHRIFWGSDPARGLQFLLPWWKYIRSKVPDAELDIFYGWSPTYYEQMEAREKLGISDMRETYNHIEELRQQDGIVWHGKVGQALLNKWMAKSSVWAYPTKWPEVYCITAIKAQAHGVVPICKDQFAMKDTVKYGIPIPEDHDVSDPKVQKWVADMIIETLLNPERWEEKRKEMIAWARKKTWSAVADQWEGLFREHPTWKTLDQSSDLQLTA